jgi:hypothetical protein
LDEVYSVPENNRFPSFDGLYTPAVVALASDFCFMVMATQTDHPKAC